MHMKSCCKELKEQWLDTKLLFLDPYKMRAAFRPLMDPEDLSCQMLVAAEVKENITLSVACCGCASLSGQSQGQVLPRFCFLRRWIPSLMIPSHSIPFTPSLLECHDVWVAASSFSQL